MIRREPPSLWRSVALCGALLVLTIGIGTHLFVRQSRIVAPPPNRALPLDAPPTHVPAGVARH